VAGSPKDGPLILLQHGEPVAQIGGVVVARLGRDAEVAAQEGGPDFGDQLFASVTLVAEPLPTKLPVEAIRVLGPVCLMPISA
jgi:hypothetical protein